MRQQIEHNRLPISVSLIHPGRIDTPHNEHAGNYMPMQPVHRGMIYPPEAVAGAILWCAAHPKRDMYVGSQAKAAAVIGTLAPRLTDRIMEVVMYTSHQSRTRRSSGPPRAPTSSPATAAKPAAPHEPYLLRHNSLYVKATKRPAALLGTAAFLTGSPLLRPPAAARLTGLRGQDDEHLRQIPESEAVARAPGRHPGDDAARALRPVQRPRNCVR